MTRAKRRHVSGGLYWVDVEGIAEIEAFPTLSDFEAYINDVLMYTDKYNSKFLGYVIESNQAHLLIKVGEVPLSKIMQCVQQSYSRGYNKRFDRKGTVFHDRYHSFMIKPDKTLEAVLFMAQYPIIQGLPEAINYKGSFFNHLTDDQRLATDEYFDSGLSNMKTKVSLFHKAIIKSLNTINREDIEWHENQSTTDGAMKFIDIVDFFVTNQGIDLSKLRTNTKQKPHTDIRKAIISIAHRETDKTQSFIADFFNISEATVSKIVNGDFVSNDYVESLLELWRRRD